MSEPDFELLAWQAELIYDYKMPELANKIRDCAERLKDTFEHNQKLCYDILTFLLRLKSVPLDDEVEEVPKISLFVVGYMLSLAMQNALCQNNLN